MSGGVTQDDTIPENNFTDAQWDTLKLLTNLKKNILTLK